MKIEIIGVIDRIKSIVKCHVALTGSLALAEFGVYPKNLITNPKDVDLILVNPSREDLAALDIMQKLVPANGISENFRRYKMLVKYQVLVEGYVVDLFIEYSDQSKLPFFIKDGVLYNPVDRILAAKKSLGRAKDWYHVMQMQYEIGKGINIALSELKTLGAAKLAVINHYTGEAFPESNDQCGKSMTVKD